MSRGCVRGRWEVSQEGGLLFQNMCLLVVQEVPGHSRCFLLENRSLAGSLPAIIPRDPRARLQLSVGGRGAPATLLFEGHPKRGARWQTGTVRPITRLSAAAAAAVDREGPAFPTPPPPLSAYGVDTMGHRQVSRLDVECHQARTGSPPLIETLREDGVRHDAGAPP